MPGRQKIRILFGSPWTLKTNSKPMSETSKEIVNTNADWMIMQVRGKLRDINGSGGGQF